MQLVPLWIKEKRDQMVVIDSEIGKCSREKECALVSHHMRSLKVQDRKKSAVIFFFVDERKKHHSCGKILGWVVSPL